MPCLIRFTQFLIPPGDVLRDGYATQCCHRIAAQGATVIVPPVCGPGLIRQVAGCGYGLQGKGLDSLGLGGGNWPIPASIARQPALGFGIGFGIGVDGVCGHHKAGLAWSPDDGPDAGQQRHHRCPGAQLVGHGRAAAGCDLQRTRIMGSRGFEGDLAGPRLG